MLRHSLPALLALPMDLSSLNAPSDHPSWLIKDRQLSQKQHLVPLLIETCWRHHVAGQAGGQGLPLAYISGQVRLPTQHLCPSAQLPSCCEPSWPCTEQLAMKTVGNLDWRLPQGDRQLPPPAAVTGSRHRWLTQLPHHLASTAALFCCTGRSSLLRSATTSSGSACVDAATMCWAGRCQPVLGLCLASLLLAASGRAHAP